MIKISHLQTSLGFKTQGSMVTMPVTLAAFHNDTTVCHRCSRSDELKL